MSQTKEMLMATDAEVESFTDQELLVYHNTHKNLNKQYPNSYYAYKIQKSYEEILNRGLEENIINFLY